LISLFRLAAFILLVAGPMAGADADPAALLKAGKADQAIHSLNLAIARAPNDAPSRRLPARRGMTESPQRKRGLGRVAIACALLRRLPHRPHEPGKRSLPDQDQLL